MEGIPFKNSKRQQMEGRLDGGEVRNNGGLILVREADKRILL